MDKEEKKAYEEVNRIMRTIDLLLTDQWAHTAFTELLTLYNKWQDEECEGVARIYDLYDKKDIEDILDMCETVQEFYCATAMRMHSPWVCFKGALNKSVSLSYDDVRKMLTDASVDLAVYIRNNGHWDVCPELLKKLQTT